MRDRGVRRVPAVDGDRGPVGSLTAGDLMDPFAEQLVSRERRREEKSGR